jgi:large subunit ribosomal protein L6
MSRVGKKPIDIPGKVQVTFEDGTLKTKGPLGELELEIPDTIKIEQEENTIKVSLARDEKRFRPLWGLYRALVANVINGVNEGFEKKLLIEGVGYRAEANEKEITMNLGYSHPVIMEVPEGLKVQVEKNVITVSGIDKQQVGQMAADIRSKRKPEPYKGKGIRYEDEHVRRKAGKRAVAGGGA